MVSDKALTTTEVARRLGVDPRTVKAWVKSDHLAVWFHDDNGRAWFSERTIAAAQERAGQLHAERKAS